MLLKIGDIRKKYLLGGEEIEVLRGVDLAIQSGEFLAIMGTSGSGKSTLLHVLGGLVKPDSGTFIFENKNMLSLSDDELSWVRAHWVGFVFQTFDLLSDLDVLGNVSLPFFYNSLDRNEVKRKVDEAVERVGLAHRKKHRPAELSGGEMQRVAIARALAISPKLILADEPTGNLDARNSSDILDLFKELNEIGATIVMVTHDSQVAAVAGKVMKMQDGVLLAD